MDDDREAAAEPGRLVDASKARPASSQSSPKIYPNNTLLEDLGKCHKNLKPQLLRAACRYQDLIGACRPKTRTKFSHIQRIPRKESSERSRQVSSNQSRACRDVERRRRFVMPSSIARLNSTLSADDYNSALNVLSSDMRFKLHLLLYNRVQLVWTLITTGACVSVALLTFTTLTSVVMAAVWLASQATGLFVCRKTRKQLDRMLERSVAQVNTFFMDHNLMMGVINRGGLLKTSRFVVPLIFFDALHCIEQVDSMVKRDLVSMQTLNNQDKNRQQDQVGPKSLGTNQRVLARAQLAKKIVLDFSQRWISHFDRSKLLLCDESSKPRHLSTGKCLCQFIEENLADDEEDSELSVGAAIREVPNSDAEAVTIINFESDGLERGRKERPGEEIIRPESTSPMDRKYELSAIDLFQNITQIDLNKVSEELANSGDIASSFSCLHDRATIESSQGSDWSLSLDQDVSCQDQSESLFRSLRALFESRSFQLSKSNDANSMLDLGKSSPSDSRPMPNSIAIDRDDSTDEQSSAGKRFFARFDGVSSLVSKLSKPEGLYANSASQMLEIH